MTNLTTTLATTDPAVLLAAFIANNTIGVSSSDVNVVTGSINVVGANTPYAPSGDSPLSGGAIAGTVIAVCCVVLLLPIAIVVVVRMHKSTKVAGKPLSASPRSSLTEPSSAGIGMVKTGPRLTLAASGGHFGSQSSPVNAARSSVVNNEGAEDVLPNADNPLRRSIAYAPQPVRRTERQSGAKDGGKIDVRRAML